MKKNTIFKDISPDKLWNPSVHENSWSHWLTRRICFCRRNKFQMQLFILINAYTLHTAVLIGCIKLTHFIYLYDHKFYVMTDFILVNKHRTIYQYEIFILNTLLSKVYEYQTLHIIITFLWGKTLFLYLQNWWYRYWCVY